MSTPSLGWFKAKTRLGFIWSTRRCVCALMKYEVSTPERARATSQCHEGRPEQVHFHSSDLHSSPNTTAECICTFFVRVFYFFSDRGRIFRPVRDLCWIIAMRVYSPLQNIAFHSNSFLSARLLEPSLLRRETERTAGVWGAVQGLLEWGVFCPLFATFKKKAWFRHVQ